LITLLSGGPGKLPLLISGLPDQADGRDQKSARSNSNAWSPRGITLIERRDAMELFREYVADLYERHTGSYEKSETLAHGEAPRIPEPCLLEKMQSPTLVGSTISACSIASPREQPVLGKLDGRYSRTSPNRRRG
jgi:hypothetical protein